MAILGLDSAVQNIRMNELLRQQSNPLFQLAQGIKQSVERKQAEERQLKEYKRNYEIFRQLESDKSEGRDATQSGSIKDIEEDKGAREIQRKATIISRKFNPITGDINITERTPTPAEEQIVRKNFEEESFNNDLNSGIPPLEMAKKYPDRIDDIMNLQKAGVFNTVMSQQSNVQNNPGVENTSGLLQTEPNVPLMKYQDEKAVAEEKKKIKTENVLNNAQDTLNTIKNVEDGIEFFGVRSLVPAIPGTEKANWDANLNKLLSQKVLDIMTSLKEASATGSTGFGQLSEKELKVLQDSSTALKRTLNPKDAKKYLDDMKKPLMKILGADSNKDVVNFNSEQEAINAKLTPGTHITINGRPAIWE